MADTHQDTPTSTTALHPALPAFRDPREACRLEPELPMSAGLVPPSRVPEKGCPRPSGSPPGPMPPSTKHRTTHVPSIKLGALDRSLSHRSQELVKRKEAQRGQVPCPRSRSCWYGASTRPNSVQFSRSVMSDSLRPHGLQHARPPCLSPTPRAYSNSCQLSR